MEQVAVAVDVPSGPPSRPGDAPGLPPVGAASGGGYLPGELSVDATGSSSFRLGLDVPAGRAGLAPELALSYSSGAGDGLLGRGWSLAGMTSAIAPCALSMAVDAKTAGVKFGPGDQYCLDGQRLMASGTAGEDKTTYRTRSESFARITSSKGASSSVPDAFTVETREGRIRIYTAFSQPQFNTGAAWDAAQGKWVEGDKSGATPRTVWRLAKETDHSGKNWMEYSYTPDALQLPSKITYTRSEGRPSQRTVEFVYKNRTDPSFSYASGVRHDLTKVLSSVVMKAPHPVTPAQVWRYDLDYTESKSGHSLLHSIVKCGASADATHQNPNSCTRAKIFDYNDPSEVPSFTKSLVTAIGPAPAAGDLIRVGDFNGDGGDDVVFPQSASPGAGNFIGLSKRSSTGQMAPLANAYALDGQGDWHANTSIGASRPLDVQADGQDELSATYFDAAGAHDQVLRWDDAAHRFVTTGVNASGGSTDYGDLDGDGLIDRLTQVPGAPYEGRLNAFAKTTPHAVGFGASFSAALSTRLCDVRMTDLDGDGKADLVGAIAGSQKKYEPDLDRFVTTAVCSNDLQRIRLADDGRLIQESLSRDSGGLRFQRALGSWVPSGDFNGDGRTDYLVGNGTADGVTVLWGTGLGLTPDSHTTAAVIGAKDFRIFDVNGDGRDDILALGSTMRVLLSRGNGDFDTPVDLPLTNGSSANTALGSPTQGYPSLQVGDFNADGRADLVRAVGSGALEVLTQDTSADRTADLLVKVTDEGTPWPRETVTYSTAWNDRMEDMPPASACGADYPQVCVRRGMPVVRRIDSRAHNVKVDAANTTVRSVFYTFDEPMADVRSGFLGFASMRSWDPEAGRETVASFDNRTVKDGGFYPGVGRPVEVTTATVMLTPDQGHPTTADARVVHEILHEDLKQDTVKSPAYGSYTVVNTKTTTTEWEEPVAVDWHQGISGSHITGIDEAAATIKRKRTSTVNTRDAYLNPTKVTDTTVGGVSQVTDAVYENRDTAGEWLVGLPTTVSVTRTEPNGGGSLTRSSTTSYDAAGRVERVEQEPGKSDDLRKTVHYGYDSDGLGVLTSTKVTVPGRPDQVSHLEYDGVYTGQPDEKMFPSQMWSDYSKQEYRPSTWLFTHPGYGLTLATMDVNGRTATTTYDDLSRPIKSEVEGEQAATTTEYIRRPEAGGGTNGTVVKTTRDGVVTQTHTDALGRTITQNTPAFNGDTATTSTTYDTLGRPLSVTAPAPGGTTTFRYDTLGRLWQTTAPDGSTTRTTHTFSTTQTVDASGHEKQHTYDVDGRLTQAVQVLTRPGKSALPITTSYLYAPFDQVKQITNDQGNKTTFIYDVLGRRTDAYDPDKGHTETHYYGNGLVKDEKHVKSGHTTTLGYDDLGRVTSKTTEDGTTSYTWDSAAHGIGQLDHATSPDQVTTRYTYDTYGRPATTTWHDDKTSGTSDVSFAVDTDYDPLGRPEFLTYPDAPGKIRSNSTAFTVGYTYNTAGHLNTVYDASTTAHTPLWTVNSRKPNGALDTGTLGNGTTIKHRYDTTGMSYLTGITATTPTGTSPVDLGYEYYPNGQLKKTTENDTRAKRADTYTYDSLGQLTNWALDPDNNPETGNTVNHPYAYDTLGNITPGGETRTYAMPTPASPRPHLLHTRTTNTTNGTLTYDYDDEARQTRMSNDSGTVLRETTYTADDLPKTLKTPAGTTTYRYDADGHRFAATHPDNTTTYTPGGGTLFEQRRTADGRITTTHYTVNGPDGPIAQLDASGTTTATRYLITDRQNSPTAVLDTTSKLTDTLHYNPWGERTTPTGTPTTTTSNITHGYTGHHHEDPDGLINMQGRIMDPHQQRFTTPDPYITNPTQNNALNPYPYVANDPTNATDPTGHITCDRFCQHTAESGFNDFVQAGEAYYNGGTNGLATYERGALGREAGNYNTQIAIENANRAEDALRRAEDAARRAIQQASDHTKNTTFHHTNTNGNLQPELLNNKNAAEGLCDNTCRNPNTLADGGGADDPFIDPAGRIPPPTPGERALVAARVFVAAGVFVAGLVMADAAVVILPLCAQKADACAKVTEAVGSLASNGPVASTNAPAGAGARAVSATEEFASTVTLPPNDRLRIVSNWLNVREKDFMEHWAYYLQKTRDAVVVAERSFTLAADKRSSVYSRPGFSAADIQRAEAAFAKASAEYYSAKWINEYVESFIRKGGTPLR
ncbi:FG-GAP-like repeat-containing protein [Streptomyces sp. NPDC052013]|uniref:FG-GAP-like repeat-containing protein n=1 Tax=Streptomyces sp. NPDC052013 TaxID=3365679 RepID=UPI0037D134A1